MSSEALADSNPAITVIALCFNHARFLIECLESIRAQTFQNFQLIVTDDCSSDISAELIQEWLATHYPDADFIRHSKNLGLCKTLNEALAISKGTYISMVATDDTWKPTKLECQYAEMAKLSEEVAVLYSDALQMDESGAVLPKTFIAAHWIDKPVPSGRIFSELVDGNFIPAMATLIRLSALRAVGGYDERLTYEDYDMWLRLANHYEFKFQPKLLAAYRIVGTSIVRTQFVRPSANHSYSRFLIHEKWIGTTSLNSRQRKNWGEKLWEFSYSLYVQGDRRAGRCLWRAFYFTSRFKIAVLALSTSLGINRRQVMFMKSVFRREK